MGSWLLLIDVAKYVLATPHLFKLSCFFGFSIVGVAQFFEVGLCKVYIRSVAGRPTVALNLKKSQFAKLVQYMCYIETDKCFCRS